jgi:predicted SAM-dependent methyltransferase
MVYEDTDVLTVLNAGSGYYAPERLHPAFRGPAWREIRLDIDPRARPDVIGSVTDMSRIADASFDAVWCSHNLEHLHSYEVPKALSEFRRVLRPHGFALITSPDLQAIAQLVVDGKLEEVAYQSPAGPITPLDMLFGLSTAIEAGNLFMAHKTGFTADRFGRVLLAAGFVEVFVTKGTFFDLWALGLMPEADRDDVLGHLQDNRLDFGPEA